MAWTVPMTAVANSAFTAAQFNQYVRDNLNETAPAKAFNAGRIFVTTGTNQIAERAISSDTTTGSGQVLVNTYGDPTNVGPVVTVTTGASCLYWLTVRAYGSTTTTQCLASVEVSGASSIAADDDRGVIMVGTTSQRMGIQHHMAGALTPGSNTFTVRYRVVGGSGTFSARTLTVMAL